MAKSDPNEPPGDGAHCRVLRHLGVPALWRSACRVRRGLQRLSRQIWWRDERPENARHPVDDLGAGRPSVLPGLQVAADAARSPSGVERVGQVRGGGLCGVRVGRGGFSRAAGHGQTEDGHAIRRTLQMLKGGDEPDCRSWRGEALGRRRCRDGSEGPGGTAASGIRPLPDRSSRRVCLRSAIFTWHWWYAARWKCGSWHGSGDGRRFLRARRLRERARLRWTRRAGARQIARDLLQAPRPALLGHPPRYL
mmetsp:Transcript_1564/g.6813  ORF Transcript_1564/g.6813 Transcript_1564/m.6813 type:complete len:251 (+) Transcript_1564:1055-1807(+)